MPHAWIAGPQTTLLRDKLRTLRKGGRFVMTIPPAPYRCPPGPYERACVVADMLKRLGGGKKTVLDANPDIVAEKHTFDAAFRTIYKDIIEYRPGTPISSIDSASLKVNGIQGTEVTAIAPHSAPALPQSAGMTNAGYVERRELRELRGHVHLGQQPVHRLVHLIGKASGIF